jgi:hypothetical protein
MPQMREGHEKRADLYEGTKERKQSASDRAAYLQTTSLHGKGDTKAVIWTKAPEGQTKGARYEGTRVSPTKNGVVLHGGATAQTFHNDSVDEVHYYQDRGN